jgi:hypothetical protein
VRISNPFAQTSLSFFSTPALSIASASESRGAFMPKTLSVPLTNVASHSTAYYLLQALNEIGIE